MDTSVQSKEMARFYKKIVPVASAVAVLLVIVVTTAAALSSHTVLRFEEKDNYKVETSKSADGYSPRFVLVIDVTKALHITSPSFMSVTISGGQMSKGLGGFDFSSRKLRNLAAGLSPLDVRFGGTLADFLEFDPDGTQTSDTRETRSSDDELDDSNDLKHFFEHGMDSEETTGEYFGLDLSAQLSNSSMEKRKRFKKFTITGRRWDNLTRFCDEVDWDIMWDFNLFHFKKGRWDPAFAKKFLKYSASRGVRIPSFQLGNEPNLYKGKFGLDIGGDLLAQDFWALKDLISEMPQYVASGIYGPDVTNVNTHQSARTYLTQFLKNQGCDAVTEVSLHHYYLAGESASLKDFIDPRVMDSLKAQFEYAYNITWANCRVRKPIRLTETSTATGGGKEGVTDAYVAGFLWMDKLGLAAAYGVTHVFRQSFFASNYALIARNLEPNPDYFLSLMYKRLVEGPVFKVITDGMSPLVRVYAHCVSKRYYKYPDGALVVYYLNVATEQALLTTSQVQGLDINADSQLDLFVFTPGDDKGLLSRKVKLNGKVLEMDGDNLPKMDAQLHVGDVPLTPQSYGFVVIPYAEVPLCKHYHRTPNF